MSRVFTLSAANYLSAVFGALAENATEYTILTWLKDETTGSNSQKRVAVGIGEQGVTSNRVWLGTGGAGTSRITIFNSAEGLYDTNHAYGEWLPAIYRCRRVTNESTQDVEALNEAFLSGTFRGSFAREPDSTTTILATRNDVFIGGTANQANPFNGKVAHVAIWLRALSDSELTQLESGVNPSSLDDTGRYAYFTLTGESLENEWGGETLTVTGSVPVDDEDNPPVDAPAAIPSATITQSELTPGGTISGTATNWPAGGPTTATLSAGGHQIEVALTSTNVSPGEYTFTGALPSRPPEGQSAAWVPYDAQATVEIS